MRLLRRSAPSSAQPASGTKPAQAKPFINPLGNLVPNLKREENALAHGTTVLRAIVALLMLSFALNLTLGAVLLYRSPLHTVEPFILTLHPYTHQLMEIEPLHTSTEIIQLIIENELTHYVRQRHEVIAGDFMHVRWRRSHNFIQNRSSQRVWDDFKELSDPELRLSRTGAFTREVAIENIVRTDTWLWQVHFNTTTIARLDPTPRHEEWTAHVQLAPLRFAGTPTRIEALRNPLRYVVIQYTITKRTRRIDPT